ncbi:hypothetical protein PXJ20_02015 [Paraburkholderia sp. A1RI_3L]|uniref:hypothetical protein n=1 Tax=Paraburkholderia TaxID=1822464 RepID=UPI003B8026C4
MYDEHCPKLGRKPALCNPGAILDASLSTTFLESFVRRRIKRSPAVTAALVLLNAALYAEEKGRDVSRYRFSRESLRHTSGWYRLSQPFLESLAEELEALGWKLIDLSDTELATIQVAKIDVWPKLGNKRLGEAGLLDASDEDIFDKYDSHLPDSSGDADGDE